MQSGRSGDPGQRIIIDLRFPSKLSGFSVHGVDVRRQVSEVRRVAGPVRRFSDRDRATNSGLGLHHPANTAGLGVERIEIAFPAADIHAACENNRLRARRSRAGKPERPLQLQLRHILGRQARGAGGLEASVLGGDRPPVPGRSGGGLREASIRAFTKSRLRDRILHLIERLSGEILREHAALRAASFRSLRDHRPFFESRDDLLRRQLFQDAAGGRTLISSLVACRAMRFIERGAVQRPGGRGTGSDAGAARQDIQKPQFHITLRKARAMNKLNSFRPPSIWR